MQLDTYTLLAILSGVVIAAFVYDAFANKIKIPSTILLILTGAGLGIFADVFNIDVRGIEVILPALATLALILIVFEGALELKISRRAGPNIIKASLSALLGLLATTMGIAWMIWAFSGAPFYDSIINAIPFAVISSAVAIPTVAKVTKLKKEFTVYESTISDILGIILFNFFIANKTVGFGSIATLTYRSAFIVAIGVVASLALIYLLKTINSRTKLSFIVAVLVFIYAISRQLHLSALVVVLIFGLMLKNSDKLIHNKYAEKLHYPRIKLDTSKMLSFTAEIAFVARAVLFILFGFTINIQDLFNERVVIYGTAITVIIFFTRYVILRLLKAPMYPTFFIAPRGLITILLFITIPASLNISVIGSGVLVYVIISTGLLMSLGLFGIEKRVVKKGKEPIPRRYSELDERDA